MFNSSFCHWLNKCHFFFADVKSEAKESDIITLRSKVLNVSMYLRFMSSKLYHARDHDVLLSVMHMTISCDVCMYINVMPCANDK